MPVQIQELAAEVGLDRVAVLAWAKEFSQRPANEKDALLSRRRAEAERDRIRGEQRRVAEAAVKLKPHPEDAQPGFIPFFSE